MGASLKLAPGRLALIGGPFTVIGSIRSAIGGGVPLSVALTTIGARAFGRGPRCTGEPDIRLAVQRAPIARVTLTSVTVTAPNAGSDTRPVWSNVIPLSGTWLASTTTFYRPLRLHPAQTG